MSASNDDWFVAMRVVLEHSVDDPALLVRAILQLHDDTGSLPNRLTSTLWKRMTRAFKPAVLAEAVADPGLRRIQLWTEDAVASESVIYVRDDADPGAAEFTDRATALVVPGIKHLDAVITFVRALDERCGIVGGGITAHATRLYAAKECKQNGVDGTWDPATVARIEWDAWKWRKTRTKLTRLTPITIIGPAIWASLPPMPAFDPMPIVEDLGDCRLLRAWPVLCEPRDPDFLRGTRALREWLWPHTIQNPADHVDNDPR